MESVTRKGREVSLEPSQFHDLLFYGGLRYEPGKNDYSGRQIEGADDQMPG
jgi:hypothetical protein